MVKGLYLCIRKESVKLRGKAIHQKFIRIQLYKQDSESQDRDIQTNNNN